MKRVLVLIAALLLALGMLTSALAEERNHSKLALDLVIVIDESGSMSHPNNKRNDAYGYRHDAAAALLGLCDAKESRAALIPFSTSVIETLPYTNELLKIDIPANASNRQAMISLLYNDDKDGTLFHYSTSKGGQTNIGAALERAVDLLLANPSSNTPVIVLLTDGEIRLDKPAAPNVIDEKATAASEAQFRAAYNKAAANKIKIYTVALQKTAFNDSELHQAAHATGALDRSIQSAEDLTIVFNDFFADLVGSDVVTLTGETDQLSSGRFKATFFVPNQSIAEANVLIPVGKNSSVKLFKPGSNEPIQFDNTKYIKYATSYFTLIKIINPSETGEWYVDYLSTSKQELKDINVNVIFSYDVQPKVTCSSDPLYKTSQTNIKLRFVKPNGQHSNDYTLYKGGIQASMQIQDSEGHTLLPSPIVLEKQNDCFTTSFAMSDLIPSLQSGDYHFHFTLQGDGMDDEITVTASLANLAPELIDEGVNPFAALVIHDPRRTDYENEATLTIDLTKFVSEPDGENIEFAWMDPSGDDLLLMDKLENGKLTLTTKNTSGSSTLNIRAYDFEGDEAIIKLPVNIIVMRDVIAKEYALRITHNADATAICAGQPFTYTAQLMCGDELVTDPELLRLMDLSSLMLQQVFDKDGGKENLNLSFVQDGSQFKANATISMHASSYNIVGNAYVKDIHLPVNADAFSTTNAAPILTGTGANPFKYVEIHDPLTAFFADEATCTIDLNEHVLDPNGETLTFSLEPFDETNAMVSRYLNGSLLTMITRDQTGEDTICVLAQDPEGAQITIELPIKVCNIRKEIEAHYSLHVTMPETLEKGTAFQICAQLYKDGMPVDDTELLQLVSTADVRLRTRYANGETEETLLTFTQEGATLTANATTSQRECSYDVVGAITMHNGEISINLDSALATVGNIAPMLVAENAQDLQTIFSIDPFLWGRKDEAEYQIDLKLLFTDSINDHLTYYAAVLPATTKEVAVPGDIDAIAWATQPDLQQLTLEGDVLNIDNLHSGTTTLVLCAVDGDGQIGAYLYTRTVISQKETIIRLLLTIAIAAVVVLLIILAWYRFVYRKKWTTKHGTVSIRVNNVPLGTSAGFPKSGRADIALSALHIADAGNGELRKELMRLGSMYKLRAGKRDTVIVMRTKKGKNSFTLSLGTRTISGGVKKMIWPIGAVMQLKADRKFENTIIELKREAGTIQTRIGATARRAVPASSTRNSARPSI